MHLKTCTITASAGLLLVIAGCEPPSPTQAKVTRKPEAVSLSVGDRTPAEVYGFVPYVMNNVQIVEPDDGTEPYSSAGFTCPKLVGGRVVTIGLNVAEGVAQFTFNPPYTLVERIGSRVGPFPRAWYTWTTPPEASANYAQYVADGPFRVACAGGWSPQMNGTRIWLGRLVWGDSVRNVFKIDLGTPPLPPNPPPQPQDPTSCDQFIYDPAACTGAGGNWGNGTGGVGGPSLGCPLVWVEVEISYNGGATWSTLWAGWATTC